MRTRVVTVAMLALMLVGGLAPAASAVPDSAGKAGGSECWGIVSAQAAKEGGLGTHSSEQEEPRSGLGNLSRELGFDSLGSFGSFLATVDGIDSTECSQPDA
ncbi:MAG TPA: hypothetical protein VFZ70_07410 [Euzebyales bacterium]